MMLVLTHEKIISLIISQPLENTIETFENK